MSTNSEVETIPTDTFLRVVANEQCRYVLTYLANASDEIVSVSELATHVKEHCSGSRTHEQIVVRLHHVLLPKLEDTGLLEYDSRRNTVRYYSNPGVERTLNFLEKNVR